MPCLWGKGSRIKLPLAVNNFLQTEASRYTVFHTSEHTDAEGVEAGGGEGGGFRSSSLGVLKLIYGITRLFRDRGEGLILGPAPTSTQESVAHLLPLLNFQMSLSLEKGFRS